MSPESGRGTRTGELARVGFTDPTAALTAVHEAGLGDEVCVAAGQGADPDLAARSLARLVSAAERADPAGAADLRARLALDGRLGARLVQVLGASAALGDHFARHPGDWRALSGADLDRTRPTAAAITGELCAADSPDELRAAYRRLLARLAARDLTAGLHVSDVAGELADLAAGAVEAALRLAVQQAGVDADGFRLAVIGLGKCGARELNYVSDVDVLFVAEPAQGAPEGRALKDASAVAAAMMRICSDHTPEGTLWPVDAALRPEGQAGPLVRSLASHTAYYERWARTWEFQALMRARPIAGDIALGERFVDALAPLVWSAADRPGFVEDVRAMRRRVVETLPTGAAERELKLGPGGLRDIEFAVQLLQLVHGRTDLSLHEPNTWAALGALTAGGYVGRDDGESLSAAYSLLRSIEHRLQLHHLRRTHTLPSREAELRVLGRSLGLRKDPAREVEREWRRCLAEVRRLHEKLFYRPLLGAVAALPGEQTRLSSAAARDRLAALGYLDSDAAMRHLEALTSGVSRRAAIQRTLLPVLLGWLAEGPDPDLGLLAFRRLSEALGGSHWYLRMLRDEGSAAQRVARLLSVSRLATDLLMRAPDAAQLLGDDAGLPLPGAEAVTAEALAVAARHDQAEVAVSAVRALRRRELFRVAAADVLGLLDVEEVGTGVSGVTRASLRAAVAVAARVVSARRPDEPPVLFSVIAMGRLGGGEMSYGSDADVLFVFEPGEGADERATAQTATEIAAEARRLLALPGPDPALSVDADLRPEGRQGPLVRSLESYRAYYARWGRLWEVQALLRAAPLAGDPGLAARFIELVDPLRYPAGGLSAGQLAEIRRLKARVSSERLPRGVDPRRHVKLGPGGLADVEWAVQLLQLRHAGEVTSLRTTRTLEALAACVDQGFLDADEAAALRSAWRWATRLRNASALVRGRQSDVLPGPGREQAGVADVCGYAQRGVGALVEDYQRAARRAHKVVERVLFG